MALNADVMRQHFTDHADSGDTVANYCYQHDLSVASYYYWRKKLNGAVEPTASDGFSQIIARPETSSPKIILPSGLQFEVTGMDASSLASLLLELDRAYA